MTVTDAAYKAMPALMDLVELRHRDGEPTRAEWSAVVDRIQHAAELLAAALEAEAAETTARWSAVDAAGWAAGADRAERVSVTRRRADQRRMQ